MTDFAVFNPDTVLYNILYVQIIMLTITFNCNTVLVICYSNLTKTMLKLLYFKISLKYHIMTNAGLMCLLSKHNIEKNWLSEICFSRFSFKYILYWRESSACIFYIWSRWTSNRSNAIFSVSVSMQLGKVNVILQHSFERYLRAQAEHEGEEPLKQLYCFWIQ